MAEPIAYACHGLVVRSDVPIAAPPAPRAAVPDVEVRLGESRSVEDSLPPGRLQALQVIGRERVSMLVRQSHGWVVRYPGFAEVVVDAEVRQVEVHLDSRVDPGFAPVLVGGSVLAWILRLRGEHVLHASAVSHGERAVAFVGDSGAGKSTLAVACARAGARVITDDVLCVDVTVATCPPGVAALRLRPRAHRFVAELESTGRSTGVSADGRTIIELDRETTYTRLGAIVLPLIERAASAPSIRRLTAPEAMVALTTKTGPGFMERGMRARQFRQRACLVRAVPVFEATLPWGNGPSQAAVEELLALAEGPEALSARGAS